MGIWEIIVGILVLIFSVIMIIVIILQEGHEAGLGTITGGADSFLSRGKARTADAIFARVTKYCAIAFFVFIVLLNAMQYFGLTGASKDTDIGASDIETSVVSEVSKEASDSGESSDAASSEEASAAAGDESSAVSSETSAASSDASTTSEEASTDTSDASEEASAAESAEESEASEEVSESSEG